MNAKTAKAIRKASKLLGNNGEKYRKTKAFYDGLNDFERKEFMKMTKEIIVEGTNAIS